MKTQFYTEFSDTIQVLWCLCCLCMFSLIFIFPVCNSNYLAAIQSCLQHTHWLQLCSPSWFISISVIIIHLLLKNKPSLPICPNSSTDPLVSLFNKYLSNFSNPCSHLGGTPPKALSLSAIISHLLFAGILTKNASAALLKFNASHSASLYLTLLSTSLPSTEKFLPVFI